MTIDTPRKIYSKSKARSFSPSILSRWSKSFWNF